MPDNIHATIAGDRGRGIDLYLRRKLVFHPEFTVVLAGNFLGRRNVSLPADVVPEADLAAVANVDAQTFQSERIRNRSADLRRSKT